MSDTTPPISPSRGAASKRCPRFWWASAIIGAALVAPAAAHAQGLADYDYEDLEFRGIGAEAGRVWPARVEPANYFGLIVDLGYIGPRLRIQPLARFWSSRLIQEEVEELAQQIILVCERQMDVSCPERLDLGEVRLSDLELAAEARFEFLPARRLSPFLGGGLALHLLNGRGDFVDGTFVEDLLDTVTPGLSAAGGLNFRLFSTLQLTAEARFVLANDVRYGSAGFSGVWTLPTPGSDMSGSSAMGTR